MKFKKKYYHNPSAQIKIAAIMAAISYKDEEEVDDTHEEA